MSTTDKPGRQESWTRWALRSAYETGQPRGRRDVIEAAALLVVALLIRIVITIHDWLPRAVVAYLITIGATLLLGYAAHYAGRRLHKVAA